MVRPVSAAACPGAYRLLRSRRERVSKNRTPGPTPPHSIATTLNGLQLPLLFARYSQVKMNRTGAIVVWSSH